MRSGSHPLKKKGKLEPPKEITIQMVTFIPFLEGYFEQSLDVLKASLESLWANTSLPYDLMIFDNGSCAEVRQYLLEQQQAHKIQFLFLSDENVGLPGAWNALFRAAPGKIIAYSDSDIYFYPGWLEACLEIIKTYPNTGMVTGIPVRNPPQHNTRTLEWAQSRPADDPAWIESGCLMPWDIYWAHARSLGQTEEEARQRYNGAGLEDTWLTYRGLRAGIGAGHFQFVSPSAVLSGAAPFPYIMAMGNERYLDDQVNEAGYLRLTTTGMYVRHIGNRLTGEGYDFLQEVQQTAAQAANPVSKPGASGKFRNRLLNLPPVRKVLLGLYNLIFRLYYDRK